MAVELKSVRHYPLVGELPMEDLEAILPYMNEHDYVSGDILLQQGKKSDRFHILLSGSVDVVVEQDTTVHVARLARGSFVGELSCLTGDEVSATVKAVDEVRSLSLPRDGLMQLMDSSLRFRRHMIEAMSERIRNSNKRVLEEYTRSLVVMKQYEQEKESQHGPLVGSSPFICELKRQVPELAAREEPICIVGEDGVGKSHIAAEIHKRSNRRHYPVIFLDGSEDSPDEWEMKLRAAKRGTIVLERADCLPPAVLHEWLQSVDDTFLMMTARQMLDIDRLHEVRVVPIRERAEDIPELVHAFLSDLGVLHPEEIVSQEAMHMLAAYPYLGHNIAELKRVVHDALVLSGGKIIRLAHLRFGSTRQPGTRPKIGLALGSGSVRGAAHVGVLKVLEEANIPVDVVAGTSVGAFIGALYVGGQPISAFEKVLPTVRWHQLARLSMPPRAVIHNGPMERFVEKYIGPVDFEDLPIPFAAVASDAVSGEAYILNKGKVSHAIRATTAIPGVMAPVEYEGRLLVDGAVVHPVPVALAKSLGADIVIAVDLSLPNFTRKAPKHFIAAILNTIEMMSRKIVADELQLADIVLRPELESSQISFKSSPFYIQRGAEAAHRAIAEIQKRIQEETGNANQHAAR